MDSILDTFKKRLNILIEKKQDSDLTMNAKKQAEQMGIAYSTFMKYLNGTNNTIPGIDKLNLIADYYNVSTDYLLGRTEIRSPEMIVNAAHKETGLSENAIGALKKIKKAMSDEMNFIIENDLFREIVTTLYRSKFQLDNLVGSNTHLIYEAFKNDFSNNDISQELNNIIREVGLIGLEKLYKQDLTENIIKLFDEYKEKLDNV